MKRIKANLLVLIVFIMGGCSQYKSLNDRIITNLKVSEINIDNNSLKTTKLYIQELSKLYPDFEFYSSSVNTMYMEYPELKLITLSNTKTNQIFLLTSMSFKQMEPEFLNQFEDRIFESNEAKNILLRGFAKIYEQLERGSKMTMIDSTDFDNIKFVISDKRDMKETFYLQFEENNLVDFNLDFKGIPIH